MTDSPFLPGTRIQYAWDSTSLGWLKECPRKYQYSMIDGWRYNLESVHLRFGLLYHQALEHYDRLRAFGTTHADALTDTTHHTLSATWDPATGTPWSPDHNTKTRETLVRSVIWYLDEFGANDATQTVILANGKPAVELSFKLQLDYGPTGHLGEQPYLLCGHLDRVVTYGAGTYVMDRKTTSSTPGSSYFEGYSPDNQMSLYSLAAKIVYKTPVKGVIIDAAQVAVGFSRFSRGLTHRTDAQLHEWLDDTRHWLALAHHYAERNHWPQNDKSCHHFGGCVFRRVCSKSPEVRQAFLETDFHREPWNPLEVR